MMAGSPDRHPQDWYVEQTWTVRALMQVVEFDRHATIWDPCCGLGTIPRAFADAGFAAQGTDLVDRWLAWELRHLFMGEHDFLGQQVHLMERMARLNIVFNPPYGYKKDIAERCVRRALMLADGLVCALLPIRWRASEKRYPLFAEQHPPRFILEFCDRPSMPPGDALANRDPATGKLTAWKRGKTDYAWYVWDTRQPATDTITRIIPPRTAEQKKIDRDFDLRRVGVLPQLEMAA
ncbi:TRM11 family methyltransferase [Sphingobium yanoikuyae]|uniref:Methyltransferase n=1 Tax=Sphingobium yanoikuyae TaxID=13690 RepID=A0A9X7UBI9_SPHYA|nr:hypothetical protein [Sphingobium yanoikuyae]QNG47391.1 hypothetical protein H3V42_07215 [Sphingobium yanoikuyae]